MSAGGALRRLASRRRLARAALLWERLWPALWPPVGVFGLFLTIALLGLPLLLPGWVRPLLAMGFGLAITFVAWRSFRGFTWPGNAAGDRRLEQASGLAHRPLAMLADRPAGADPMAAALWEAHRRRTLAGLTRLKIGPPRPGLARRDPRALRVGLGLALLSALVVAGPEAPERLRRSLLPDLPQLAALPGLRLEAWITPPAYTGAAPMFLDPAGGTVRLPAGSRLQVALTGGQGGLPMLLLDAAETPFRPLDAGSYQAEALLPAGTRLAIRRDGREVAGWTLSVQPDTPPEARFTEAPHRAARGLALRLPWQVEDDWGVATASAEIRLVPRPDAAPHVIEIGLPGGQVRTARGTLGPDLSAHPWAGIEVELRILARDGAGQEGASAPARLILPERAFTHPVAQAMISLRKQLSLDPAGRREAMRTLDTLSADAQAFEHDTTTFLALRAARHRLQRDRRPDAVTEVQEILWEAAIALEEGRSERTARALQDARQALREALEEARRLQEEARRENDANREANREAEQRGEQPPPAQDRGEQRAETDRRIQELRDAIRRHLDALAEQLQRENAEAMPLDPQSRMISPRELDRRTNRMRDANRQDRIEDAERELAELEEQLRALEEGRSPRSAQQERQRQQRERGQQQMGVVQDMVRRQTRMLDSGHQRAQGEQERADAERRQQQLQARTPWARPTPEQTEAQRQAREQAEAATREETGREARTQRALRRALGEVMQQFGDLTGEVPAPLGRADQAMREAQEALAGAQDARGAQERAIRELQEGSRQMAQQMQRQFGQGQEGEGEGEGEEEGDMMGEGQGQGEGQDQAEQQGQGRDPLGRRSREAPGAQDAGSDTRVPDEAELLRTRRIQEELRKRGAERGRPAEELDYIDRLLRRF